jgi:WD40 repeat protein
MLYVRFQRLPIIAFVAGSVLSALFIFAPATIASTGSVAEDIADVDGIVYASVQMGDRTIIGGQFTTAGGLPRQNVAAIEADGTVDPTWNPSVDGIVYAVAPSDDGTKIFLGGGFTTVDGVAHGRIAAVDSVTGALISSWKTQAKNNLVRALATSSGRLYVGGSFSRIGGKAVNRLASLDQATGVVNTSFAPHPDATVRAVDVSPDGQKLYAGGPFKNIALVARPGAAELNAADGTATGFAPTDGGVVIAIDTMPDGSRVFFSSTNNRTWAYDPAVSNTPAYRVRTGGDVQAIAATSDEVYIGGHFLTLPEAKVDRLKLASFDPSNGAVTDWNPGANGPFGVWTITAAPDFLAIGGDFTRVGGVRHQGFARFPGTP